MRILNVVSAALLTSSLAGCASGGAAEPQLGGGTAPGSVGVTAPATGGGGSRLVAITVDGVVVNELDVLEPRDATAMARELSAHGGVVVSHDSRLGTYLVWFPTKSRAEITKIRDALTRKGISSNLVLVHAPLG